MEESVVLSDTIEMLRQFQQGNLEEAEEERGTPNRTSSGYNEFTPD